MAKYQIVAFLLLLSFALTFAAENNLACQYRFNATKEVESLKVYAQSTGAFITDSIRYENSTGYNTVTLKFYNDYDVPLTIRVIFDFSARWMVGGWGTETHDSAITIAPRDTQKIVEGRAVNEMYLNMDTLRIIFQNNNDTYARYIKENITEEVCTQCGEAVCLNDGYLCNNSLECGGGFCIRGRCSHDKNCYMNDCQCGDNALQCRNDSCVPKRTISVGQKTSCNMDEECITGLSQNNICIKSEIQKQEEEEAAKQELQRKKDAEEKEAQVRQSAEALAKQKQEAENIRVFIEQAVSLLKYIFIGLFILLTITIVMYLYYRRLENAKKAAAKRKREEEENRRREAEEKRQDDERRRHQNERRSRRSESAADDPYTKACETLDVDQDAGYEECKKKWLNWQRIYHRDTMPKSDPEAKNQAEEQLKKINSAWELIKDTRGWS